MKLRVIISDDERIARQRLQRLLEQEQSIEIVAECADGKSTIDAIRQQVPDLVFLDIKMPGMDGFDVVEALDPEIQPAIVFVTAFDKHAVHAFETCALDYLLKPVAPARLAKTLARVRNHLQSRESMTVAVSREQAAQRFAVRSGQTTSFISPEEIDWIEADGNYAILHVGKRNHLLRETMSALETQLPATAFTRVSRSAILHLNRVKEIRAGPDDQHVAILNDGQQVLITRSIRQITKRLRTR
jgi:two-component system LytT family response regulator